MTSSYNPWHPSLANDADPATQSPNTKSYGVTTSPSSNPKSLALTMTIGGRAALTAYTSGMKNELHCEFNTNAQEPHYLPVGIIKNFDFNEWPGITGLRNAHPAKCFYCNMVIPCLEAVPIPNALFDLGNTVAFKWECLPCNYKWLDGQIQ